MESETMNNDACEMLLPLKDKWNDQTGKQRWFRRVWRWGR